MSNTDRFTPRSIGVLIASFLLNFVSITPAISVTFGQFLVPVTTEFGWSRSSFSVVLTIVAAIGVFGYPLAGRLADRFGPTKIAILGFLPYVGALALLGFAEPNRAEIYLLFAIIGAAATGPSAVILAKIVAAWFPRNTGLLVGLAVGFPIGASCSVMPLLPQSVIAEHGWRAGYQAIAALVAVLGLPALVFLRSAPDRPAVDNLSGVANPVPAVGIPSRVPTFWILLILIALGAGCINAFATHMVPISTDRGVSAQIGTWGLVLLGVVNSISQIIIGWRLDRARGPRFLGILMMAACGGLIVFSKAHSSAAIILGGAFLGIGAGSEYGLLPVSIIRYFGLQNYATIYGTIFGVLLMVSGIAPVLMDVVFDNTGSYDLTVAGFAIALIGCSALIFMLPRFSDSKVLLPTDPDLTRTEALPVAGS